PETSSVESMVARIRNKRLLAEMAALAATATTATVNSTPPRVTLYFLCRSNPPRHFCMRVRIAVSAPILFCCVTIGSFMSSPTADGHSKRPQLRRALSLWDLLFYGIVLIQPTAPMPLFGVVSQEARGHVVTAVLIAMVAMLFTAISYGRMARAYPSAGSGYTYVGREIHSGLGFITGWSMPMDYMLNPIICTIWCSKASGNIIPQIPYAVWAVFFAVLFTGLNLRGIRATARTNELLVLGMFSVIVYFFVAAVRYLLHQPAVSLTRPFYDPATFSWQAISTGTSIAVLTYIGFDGISTLSEEVHNPRRNILLATVLTCLITGLLATLEVYAGQLVWPDYATYPDV